MATIGDVARRAGFSKMTVSRVLNNKGYVKEETRRRITDAIAEFNYRPNMIARGLVTGHSHTVAHVMLDIDDMIHVAVNSGFEEACYERGYSTIVCDASRKSREDDYIDMIIDKQIDGAMFHHLDITEEQAGRMIAAGVKCVLIDNENEITSVSNIYTNNYRGGYIAAEHLIERGHKKLGCMHGLLSRPEVFNELTEYVDTFQFNIWRQRTQGFCDAIKARGLEVNKKYFYQGDGTMKHGLKLASDIMKQVLTLDDRPTAMYCENDVMAVGAINALLELKLDVPETMAIIGHDGIEIGEILYPRLTTIDQPRYQMGYLAAETLIDLIKNKSGVTNRVLDPKLIVRETT